MRLAVGLLLALLSTSALNWGFVAQHGAAAELPPLRLRTPLRSLSLLLRARRWLLGFLVGIGGWVLYVAALGVAPLSLVQAVSAAGVAVLAVLVQLSPLGGALGRREWGAVGLALTGLVLLGLSLTGAADTVSPQRGPLLVWLAVSAALAGLLGGLRSAAGLGGAAGVLYAAGDVATKAAVSHGGLAFVPAVLAAHGLAFVALQLGFQRGSALVTVGLATLLTNALPIAGGMALFGERLPGGAPGALRLAAFVLAVAGGTLLARSEAAAAEGDGQEAGATSSSAYRTQSAA